MRHRLLGLAWILAACEPTPPAAESPAPPTPAPRTATEPLAVSCPRVDGPTTAGAPVTPTLERTATGLRVTLPLEGNDVVLALTPNRRLFADDYQELIWTADGPIPGPERPRDCHYQGAVETPDGQAFPDGVAALSDCDGALTGVISLAGGFWSLDAPAQDGRLRLVEIERAQLHLAPLLQVAGGGGATRWVELLVVNDFLRSQALGGQVTANTATVANITDALYQGGAFGRPIRVALVGQVTFAQGDPFVGRRVGAEVDPNDLINRFGAWRAESAADLPAHDAASLMSGDDFQGNTAGVGWVGSLCNPNFSTHIVEDAASAAITAAIEAHELGHNFGADHDADGNACPANGFIMAAGICQVCAAPDAWSQCSVASIDAFLARTGGACLENVPAGVDQDRCGDGLVTGAEACDCGGDDCALVDPCCDGATCALAPGAACSAGQGCCDPQTCAPRAAGVECRASAGVCDVAERCDGADPACPANAPTTDGDACAGGVCFDSRCVGYEVQCQAVSPDASAAGCAQLQADAPCGDLICFIDGQCFIFGDGLGGTLSVEDGTPCGAGRACADGECVADGVDACPADPDKVAPGVCGCGVPDVDGDGDGALDCQDACPADPAKVLPGACGCGIADRDGDGDAVPDCVDGCPADPAKVAAGICGCDTPDDDDDGDGTPDCRDGCPQDGSKTAPGVCGCGVADVDGDGDGAPDCQDLCPDDLGKSDPGVCGCGVPDTDRDGDGSADCVDGCPGDPAKLAPGGCGCGQPDADRDGDGALDCVDLCADDPAKQAPGACGCGVVDTPGCGAACAVPFAHGEALVATDEWLAVALPPGFTAPVVLTTPQYGAPDGPFVVRMRGVDASGFELRLDALGSAARGAVTVRWMAVEAGVYTREAHGVALEAARVEIPTADRRGTLWSGTPRAYEGAYAAPVVLGQVMTANDPRWSMFYARGDKLGRAPSADALRIGRHVGEDPIGDRVPETVGYVVMEAGPGTLCGVSLAAGVSDDVVRGVTNAPPYGVDAHAGLLNAVVAAAGVHGIDGPLPLLYGDAPLGPESLAVAVDEDQLGDAERYHPTERLAWLAVTDACADGDGDGACDAVDACAGPGTLDFETGVVRLRTDAWTSIATDRTYAELVVLATPVEVPGAGPFLVRLRAVGPAGFEARLALASDAPAAPAEADVHYVALEAGVYTAERDGIALEAGRVEEPRLEGAGRWAGTPLTTQRAYANPVVLGAVQTANDPRPSAFFAFGAGRYRAPGPAIRVGRHNGEGDGTDPIPETLGYLVAEAGGATVCGRAVQLGVGADAVLGVGNAPPYAYDLALADPAVAVLSSAGMDGGSGGWPVLFGLTPVSSAGLRLAIEEDQYQDLERSHTSEQAAFLVLAGE